MPARRSDLITRGVSGRIGSSISRAPATSPSTAMNTHEEPSSIDRRRTSRAPRGSGAPPETNEAFPSATRRGPTSPSMPAPCFSITASGNSSSTSCSRAERTTAAREHVRRHLIERGREAEQLSAVDRPERLHVGHRGDARRQGAGLVEHQHRASGEGLESPAALDDDASLRRARDARHDRDRHGEDQRARRRDHHDREEAQGVARDHPRPERDHQRDGDEDRGVSVGQADGGRLLVLCGLHEPHDARVGAVLARTPSPAGRTRAPALTAPERTRSLWGRSTGRDSPVSADSSSTASPINTPSTGTTSPVFTRSRSP